MSPYLLLTLSLLISGILAAKYAGKPKKDKGFQLAYAGLSYRRKMIRAIVFLPIMIGIMTLLYLYTEVGLVFVGIFGIVTIVVFGITIHQNYLLWKQEERTQEKEQRVKEQRVKEQRVKEDSVPEEVQK